MPNYPYTLRQIEQIVAMEKHPRDWGDRIFVHRGEKSADADCHLDLLDGSPVNLRLSVKAQTDKPLTYRAALILADQRIRGVDYDDIERIFMYGKIRIPKGWHENIVNPNLVHGDANYNVHKALTDFQPYDLVDFTRKVASMWNIVLPPVDLL